MNTIRLNTIGEVVAKKKGGETGGAEDVFFYDYDGVLLHTFSADAFLALKQMPKLPEREGLICQGWNWSLEDAQSYVKDCGMLVIGANYITDNGKTRFYVRVDDDVERKISLYIGASTNDLNWKTIDWGDGSEPQTEWPNKTVSHTYPAKGDYCIEVEVRADTMRFGGSYTSSCVMGPSGTDTYRSAMYVANRLLKIEIGDKVERIDPYAFSGCLSLTCVSIPKSIQVVAYNCFSNCYNLAFLAIPEGVTTIEKNSFENDYSLENVSFPKSVTALGNALFKSCRLLQKCCFPKGMTAIPESLFENCTELKRVTPFNGVQSIGQKAFYSTNIKTIVLPETITSLGQYAFANMKSLSEINIPKGASLASYLFQNCYALKAISLPEGLTTIPNYAFYATAIESIEIPEGVTSIGQYAFCYCKLRHISIPASLITLNTYCFDNCNCLASIEIPDGITSIPNYAFRNCTSLRSIRVPSSVTSIGQYAFQSAKSLVNMDFSEHSVIPTLGSYSVDSLDYACKIIVPDALYDEWIAATNWSNYASKIIKKSDWDASQS